VALGQARGSVPKGDDEGTSYSPGPPTSVHQQLRVPAKAGVQRRFTAHHLRHVHAVKVRARACR
jgi:hypothetical protein